MSDLPVPETVADHDRYVVVVTFTTNDLPEDLADIKPPDDLDEVVASDRVTPLDERREGEFPGYLCPACGETAYGVGRMGGGDNTRKYKHSGSESCYVDAETLEEVDPSDD